MVAPLDMHISRSKYSKPSHQIDNMIIEDYELEVVSLFPINIKLSLHAEVVAGDRGSRIPKGLIKGERYIRKNFIGYYSDPALILKALYQYEVAIAIRSAQNISDLRLALGDVGFQASDLRELRSDIRHLREEQKLRQQISEETERCLNRQTVSGIRKCSKHPKTPLMSVKDREPGNDSGTNLTNN
jgi:hypothetical protein